jgi:hypothetical protein
MAFDLLKLQILQETLTLFRNAPPGRGMCTSLTDANRGITAVWYYPVIPTITNIIDHSMEIASRGDPDSVYLWPLGEEGKCNRIKYLERLIEDEMSGTYFMDMNYEPSS